MRYDILTEENYGDIIAKLGAIKARRGSEREMLTVHGYEPVVTDAAMKRWQAESDGLPMGPIPEETVTITKSELKTIAAELAVPMKPDDDSAKILDGVKSAVGITEKPTEK
jgi:hypothetical protein